MRKGVGKSCVINSDNENISGRLVDVHSPRHPLPSFLQSSSPAPSSPSSPPAASSTLPASVDQDSLSILHFNDVYNIEGRDKEPVGGAARFKTCLDGFRHLDPITLFSGDALSPSNSKLEGSRSVIFIVLFPAVSVVMKGEQMVPVLNALDIQCAVYGNHDFGNDYEVI